MAYFDQMSLSRRAWESAGGAVVAGALTGILLGVNLWAYIVATLVSVVGALPAGSQHRTVGGALLRGLVGGTLWSTALLIAHGVTGLPATSALPEPPVAFLPFCFLPTALVAAIVWLIANRRRASTGNALGAGAPRSRIHGGAVGSPRGRIQPERTARVRVDGETRGEVGV
ncbi:hypothetical protein BOX37_25090 [Nocardia mangyaensis]|uniref:Uncharacterized protein n=2 Tax=Nocardia mangyaensis TaxID=2213200 RepID=A0A1J0VX50_9NOCA|nr:hypothetical protein BOX37_25090 [Nocardia mangyaensis]